MLALQGAPYRPRIAELKVEPCPTHNHMSVWLDVTSSATRPEVAAETEDQS